MYAQWVQLGLAKEKKQIMYIIHFHLSNIKAICICQIVVFLFSTLIEIFWRIPTS